MFSFKFKAMSSKKFSSAIWKYFTIVNDDSAKCKVCQQNYSRKGKGTTSLKNHLQRKHQNEYESFRNEDGEKKLLKENIQPSINLQTRKREYSQTSFDSYVEKAKMWDNTNPKSIKIDYLIAEMLALCDLPFQHVEELGFRRLMNHVTPNYDLKGRKYFTNLVCNELYNKVSVQIKSMLKNFEKMSFTADIWSDSTSGVSLLSLTCHGITQTFDRKNIVLRAEVLKDRHTGDYISEMFQSMFREWEIAPHNVHCIVRDGGSNMKRGCNLSNFNNTVCTAHKLHLVVKESIKNVELISMVLVKCKKIAGHFNHSTMAKQDLKTIQIRLNQNVLKVLQDCPTRWNSTLHMVERLLCIKDSLSLYATTSKIEQLDAEEWALLQEIGKVLKPIDEVTKQLSSSHSCLSDVIPLVRALKRLYDEMIASSTHSDIAIDQGNNISLAIYNLMTALKTQLNIRFGEIESDHLYQMTTYLDPRYKGKFFTDYINEDMKRKLSKTLEEEVELTTVTTKSTERYHDEKRGSLSIMDSITRILDSDDENSDREISGTNCSITEYAKEKRLPKEQSPLQYWKINSNKFPGLSHIARTYLSTPATSVPSEQFFSAAGIIYDPHRNRLQGDKAAKLLFLKYNLPLLNFNYS